MKRNIIITGAAGFIGSKVARRFLDEGFNVIGVDDLSGGNIKNVPKEVDFIEKDLSNKKILNLLPKKCYQILHLAGQSSGETSFDDPTDDLKKNTVSTLNLISYGINSQAKRIIYASSMSVYGELNNNKAKENIKCNPLSCYGVSKLTSEKYLEVFRNKIPYISLRMFNVYGPGQNMNNLRQGMVSIYLAQAIKKKKIVIKGSLDRVRDFIYIDDVSEVWFKSSIASISNKIINVGTGKATKVSFLIKEILRLLPGTSYTVAGSTIGDQNFVCSNNKLLKTKLKFKKFISLKEGLNIFINSLKKKSIFLR